MSENVDRLRGLGGVQETSRFELAPGVDFEQSFDDLQQGIRVDNLSTGWLFCDTVKRFIPPLTFGWKAPIHPASRRIVIRSVSAPITRGDVLSIAGDTSYIEITTFPMDESEGVNYGNTSDITTPSLLVAQRQRTTNAAANTSNTDWLVQQPIIPGRPANIRIVWVAVRLQSLANPAPIWVNFFMFNSGMNIANLGLSAEMPGQTVMFTLGGIVPPGPDELWIEHRGGSASRTFQAMVGYYADRA